MAKETNYIPQKKELDQPLPDKIINFLNDHGIGDGSLFFEWTGDQRHPRWGQDAKEQGRAARFGRRRQKERPLSIPPERSTPGRCNWN